MEQELISKKIAIIGAGPAGCMCAKVLSDKGISSTVFEKSKILATLLPTGGGKCNLGYAEFDFKELSKNYPRGEKFLYSVFSQFDTSNTIDFFKTIGIDTYIREDNRIFPVSNSSADVRNKFIHSISSAKYNNEEVLEIKKVDSKYNLKTNNNLYEFDIVVIAIGGHSGVEILRKLNLNINAQTQALVGLTTGIDYSELAGVSIKNVKCDKFVGDILFTHRGISGPLVYTLSSIYARRSFPYNLSFQLHENFDLQELLNTNSNKEIKNLLGQFLPKSFSSMLLNMLNINPELKCHKIDRKTRDKIKEKLNNFIITVTGKFPQGEVVTCGGVDLTEINPKTLESKKYPNLYFCGEILDIDGFCGGFNLQNCWSTGYITAKSILK